MKIAVVLLEVNDDTDFEKLEESLITHNHHALLQRILSKNKLNLSSHHYSFIQMLSEFYSRTRYDRFKLSSVYDLKKEQGQLALFIGKLLGHDIEINELFGAQNTDETRRKIGKCILKLTSQIYDVIKERSSELNIFTYELPYDSKASQVFIAGKTDHIDHRIARAE